METTALWPVVFYVGAVLFVPLLLVALSFLLGERHRERATGEPYESGIAATGSARIRFSADFYLVGLLFVIFDLEVAFLFAWAVAAEGLGWPGLAALLVFVAILVVGLVYEWSQGALDWGPGGSARSRRRARAKRSRTRAA